MTERILAVERIIIDNPYGISVKEIIEKAQNEYGYNIEKKSIYTYIALLKKFLPIDYFKSSHNTNIYYLRNEKKIVGDQNDR